MTEDCVRICGCPFSCPSRGTRRVVVIVHHPPYSDGSHKSDTEIEQVEIRQLYVPIWENGGADIVFNGHRRASGEGGDDWAAVVDIVCCGELHKRLGSLVLRCTHALSPVAHAATVTSA